jgi:hypothetical protein
VIAALIALGLTVPQAITWSVLFEEKRLHEYGCLSVIFDAESSWNPAAVGDEDRGGSYGLPQRHEPAHGKPPQPWPVAEQVRWALDYADERYGGVCEGLDFRRQRGWW